MEQNIGQPGEIVEVVKRSPLLLSFIVHFPLVTFGIQGYWSPDSYLFYNVFFLATLLWTIHSRESAICIACLAINISAIVFDIIVLSVYFPRESFGSADRFSAGMAILNLVIRPLSSLALFKAISAGVVETGGRQGYEDVPGQQY